MLKQIFTDEHIDLLLNTSCIGKYELRDRFLISQLSYVTLSLVEHNHLKIHNVLNERGEVCRKWLLPAAYSRNNEDRIIEVPEVYCQALELYLDWYVMQDLPSEYRHNLNTFRGLSERAPLLVNDRLTAYAMSERVTQNGINKQPISLRTKVNKLLALAGLDWATAKTFENSLVIHLARHIDHGDVAKLFGYKSRRIVTDKVNGCLLQLTDALNSVYSRIKVKGH